MQRHEVSFIVDAPPHRVWKLFHPPVPAGTPTPRHIDYPGGSMDVLFDGDEAGKGLVRNCEFPIPKYLFSGGVARSWEVIIDAKVNEYSHYRGVGKPLWSKAEGWHKLTPLADGRTQLTFVETYDVVNPILRRLFEKRVHRFISRDNNTLYEKLLGYLGPVIRTPVGDTAEL